MSDIPIPNWLSPWPQLTALLDGYLARLDTLPTSEITKSWLSRACRSAQGRAEERRLLDTLDEAASLCDDAATIALRKKFQGTIPRSPTTWKRAYGDRFLDVVVELGTYGWLRGESLLGLIPTYVPATAGRSPDLQIRSGGDVVGVECKNVHMSKEVRDAFDAGRMVSGVVTLNSRFVVKIQEKLDDAIQQLSAYQQKIVVLNVSLDPSLWPIEQDVGDTLQEMTPVGCRLVVFLNYGWTAPKWMFQG